MRRLESTQSSDEIAFQNLQRITGVVRSVAQESGIFFPDEAIEDMAQEVFVRLFKRLKLDEKTSERDSAFKSIVEDLIGQFVRAQEKVEKYSKKRDLPSPNTGSPYVYAKAKEAWEIHEAAVNKVILASNKVPEADGKAFLSTVVFEDVALGKAVKEYPDVDSQALLTLSRKYLREISRVSLDLMGDGYDKTEGIFPQMGLE